MQKNPLFPAHSGPSEQCLLVGRQRSFGVWLICLPIPSLLWSVAFRYILEELFHPLSIATRLYPLETNM